MGFTYLKSKLSLLNDKTGISDHLSKIIIPSRQHDQKPIQIPIAMDYLQLRFHNTSKPVELGTLKSALYIAATAVSSVKCYRGVRYLIKESPALLNDFGRRFHSGQVLQSAANCSLRLLKNHKYKVGFCVMVTIGLGCLQWIPVSNRLHIAPSSRMLENLNASVLWELEAGNNEPQSRILSPSSPESIRAKRILEEILQGTNRALGLKNDCQVSMYIPRTQESAESIGSASATVLSRLSSFLKSCKKRVSQELSLPNPNPRMLQHQPQMVRKFGIKYGTEHLDGLGWEVMVVDSDDDNAAYLGNGKIVVYKGLLSKYKNYTDAEVATALGHEVAHGLARHGSEFLMLAPWLLSFLGSNFIVLVPVASFISRRMELEADKIGIMLTAAAGYDPRVAINWYHKHSEEEDDDDHNVIWSSIMSICSGHPTGKKRAKKLNQVEVMRKAEEMYDQVQAGHQIKTTLI